MCISMRLVCSLLLHIAEYFCRFISENIWSRGVPRRECSILVSVWRSSIWFFRKRSGFVWLPGSQGRISLCLRKKRKKWRVLFTARYSVMSLSWFLHSQQNPSPSGTSSCFAGKHFYHSSPLFLWSQWPKLPLGVPRQQIMSPATSWLLHSSLLNSQHGDFESITRGFVWYYWSFFSQAHRVCFSH